MATRSPDDENKESPHFPRLLLLQSDCFVVSWRTWLFYTSWHDPSDSRPWLGARGTTTQPRAVSLQATRRPYVPSNIFLATTRGRCCELQLMMVAGQACKPQSHTSWGWGTVRCSKVLIFLSPKPLHIFHGWDSQIHMISYFELQGSTHLVGISLLAWFRGFQIILDSTNGRFSFFDKVRSKDNLLFRLNPIEWGVASTSI
jgi:hypothetical protein